MYLAQGSMSTFIDKNPKDKLKMKFQKKKSVKYFTNIMVATERLESQKF